MINDRKIVAIVGSTLFQAEHLEQARKEETRGNVPLLSVAFMKSKDTPDDLLDERLSNDLRATLDVITDCRIDMADEVLVVNVGGYVGDSTRRHIAHAVFMGKLIRYVEEVTNAR